MSADMLQPIKTALEQISNAPKNLYTMDLAAMCVIAITSVIVTGMTLDYSLEGQIDFRDKKVGFSAIKRDREVS